MRTWLAIAASLSVLWINAWGFLPFHTDDGFISLRYARRLLDGHGLTFTDGPPVEGYSNLLYVLATAALGALGVDLVDAGRIVSVAGMSVAVAVVAGFGTRRGLLPGLAAGISVAATANLGAWCVGGLEQGLLAGLLAVGFAGVLLERWTLASVALALACWTRPDAPLFVAVVVLGTRRWRVAALPALAVGLQLAFRLGYYGDWAPNTAHAKLTFGLARAWQGADYLLDNGWPLLPLLLPALAARGRGVLWAAILAWLAYLVVIGGDIFAAGRHLVPVVVLLGLLAADGWARIRSPALASLGVGAVLLAHYHDPNAFRARYEHWEWENLAVGHLLGRAFAEEQPVLALNAAGAVPYASGLPVIDMLGLNDAHIARTEGRAEWVPGHDHGDAAYVLSRSPDLVMLCAEGTVRPCWKGDEDLLASALFRQEYKPVRFEASRRASSVLYVRRNGRAGVQVEPDRVVVPGHLLASTEPDNVARLDEQGLHAALQPGASGVVWLRMRAGRWRVRVRGEGIVLDGPEVLISRRPRRVTLRVRAPEGGRLYAVELEPAAELSRR